MATAATLLTGRRAQVAWVLEIEGIDAIWTSAKSTSGITTAWTGSGHNHVYTGLRAPDGLTREIDLLGFSLRPCSLSLAVSDPRGYMAAYLADALTTAASTYLTAAMDRASTAVPVLSTSAFPATGEIHIGPERITYLSKTATSFTTITRGTCAWGGKTNWAHTFRAPTDLLPGAVVSSHPVVWKGRGCDLYVSCFDASTGMWTTRANSELVFAGYLTGGWTESGSAEFTIDAESVERATGAMLLGDQFTGTIEGIIVSHNETFIATETDADGTRSADISVAAGAYTLESLCATLTAGLAAAYPSGLHYAWSLSPVLGTAGGAWIQWRADSNSAPATGAVTFDVWAHTTTAMALGLPVQTVQRVGSGAYTATSGTPFHHEWPLPGTPMSTVARSLETIPVQTVGGTWRDQPADELPASYPTASGYLMAEDGDGKRTVWLVSQSAGVFTRLATAVFTPDRAAIFIGDVDPVASVEYGSDEAPVKVRQIWVASGLVGKLILRALLSTGTAGYNVATHDVWPAWACGVPSTIVNASSFLAAVSGSASWARLVLVEPTKAEDVIASLCAVYGFHITWRRGQLAAFTPLTIESATPDYALTVSNTTGLVQTSGGADLIRNQMTLEVTDPITGETADAITVVNQSSIDTHGPSEDLVYEAKFSASDSALLWAGTVAAAIVAYWGHAIRRYSLTGCPNLYGIGPGDVVTVTRDDPPDAMTGTYGVSARKGWVASVAFDATSHTFALEILCPVGAAYQLGPSALLSSYNAGTKTVTCAAHEFSAASETADAARFVTGDAVVVYEVDPSNSAAPQHWHDTVASQSGNDIVLTTGLAGYSASLRYYVGLDAYNTVKAAVTSRAVGGVNAYAAIADADDYLIQDGDAACRWGVVSDSTSAAAPVSTNLYRRHRTVDDDDGAPWSVATIRDLARNVNVLYSDITNKHPISDHTATERNVQSDAYGLISGPHLVYCPPGADTLTWRLWGRCEDVAHIATYRVTVSRSLPVGTATVPEYEGDVHQSTGTISTTTQKDTTGTAYVREGTGHSCYVTVEAKTDSASFKAYLRGFDAYFATRPVA